DVVADRPGGFLLGVHLARQDSRRRDVVGDRRLLPDAHLPRKLTQHEDRRRYGRLEMTKGPAHVRPCPGAARRRAAFGQRAQGRDDVPVPRVFGQIVETVVRIEEQVLAPLIGHAVDEDLTNLKTDDLVFDIALLSSACRVSKQLPSRPEWNEWLVAQRLLVRLEDRDARIFGVENRLTALADDVDGVAEGAHRGCRAAVWTIDGAHADLRAPLDVRHRYQPSKRRTFRSRRSSNSTALPT